MTTIYVKEQGAQVGRSGERLVVRKDGNVVDSFPLQQVEQVVLMGNVQLTTQATATLLAQDIDVVFLSSFGTFRGRLTGQGNSNARLRQQQLQRMSDEAFALQLARSVVRGKVHNQRAVLLHQRERLEKLPGRGLRNFTGNRQFDQALAGMMRMQQQADQAHDIESLRGYEGKAAAYYFAALRTFLSPDWGFRAREYYPPPDPFNALLSFAYSLLQKDVLAAVNLVGLDPFLGFFHEIYPGRPSAALDLMEEWRPYLADRMVLSLVNGQQLKPADFQHTNEVRRPVQLGSEGMERVLHAYGQRLATQLYHPLAGPGGQTSLQLAIRLQARHLARVISGDDAAYQPVLAR